jgi:hypothetical protein
MINWRALRIPPPCINSTIYSAWERQTFVNFSLNVIQIEPKFNCFVLGLFLVAPQITVIHVRWIFFKIIVLADKRTNIHTDMHAW